MKKIYVNKEELKEAISDVNDEVTFFGFLSHMKLFLKNMLTDPVHADIDDYLKSKGLNRKDLINYMSEKGIVCPNKHIISVSEDSDSDKKIDKFAISYKVPKKNFERKMKRMYSQMFEENKSDFLNEEGAGAMGGATGCQTVGVSGFDSFGYVTPATVKTEDDEKKTDIIRRKIHITTEQAEQLKEATTTTNVGNYEYDAPINFNGGDDPAYDHKNMMSNSWNLGKKVGVRRKRK